ncbi:viral A-type inclusion protein [Reticulomyxa filosa]|uniref:Viral A-type inclusion protein n=1 Tax=Reticulomyxa filosa TaxID=46433 RepID=X6PE92_RETFI|nr:viral A-type inclusion protein [Reticulomyxa filosa]|eukprot:ETO36536.1 viral A-type inclusion protein [Reticulomyxa filosa]
MDTFISEPFANLSKTKKKKDKMASNDLKMKETFATNEASPKQRAALPNESNIFPMRSKDPFNVTKFGHASFLSDVQQDISIADIIEFSCCNFGEEGGERERKKDMKRRKNERLRQDTMSKKSYLNSNHLLLASNALNSKEDHVKNKEGEGEQKMVKDKEQEMTKMQERLETQKKTIDDLQWNITQLHEDFAKQQMEWEDKFSIQQKLIDQFTALDDDEDNNDTYNTNKNSIEEISKKNRRLSVQLRIDETLQKKHILFEDHSTLQTVQLELRSTLAKMSKAENDLSRLLTTIGQGSQLYLRLEQIRQAIAQHNKLVTRVEQTLNEKLQSHSSDFFDIYDDHDVSTNLYSLDTDDEEHDHEDHFGRAVTKDGIIAQSDSDADVDESRNNAAILRARSHHMAVNSFETTALLAGLNSDNRKTNDDNNQGKEKKKNSPPPPPSPPNAVSRHRHHKSRSLVSGKYLTMNMLPIQEAISQTPREGGTPRSIHESNDIEALDIGDTYGTVVNEDETIITTANKDILEKQNEAISNSEKHNPVDAKNPVASTHKRKSSSFNDYRSQQMAQLRQDCAQMRLQILRLEKEKEQWAENTDEVTRSAKRCDHLTELLTKMTDEKLQLRLKIEELESLLSRYNFNSAFFQRK